jgi:O-antigen ligase
MGFVALTAVAVCDTVGLNPHSVARALAVGGVITATWTLTFEPNAAREGRVSIAGVDETMLSFNLALALAAALFLLFGERGGRDTVLTALATVCVVIAVLLTGSRTGLAAILMLLATVLGISLVAARKAVPVLLLATLVSFLAYAFAASSRLLPDRITLFLENPTVEDPYRAILLDQFQSFREIWIWKGVGAGSNAVANAVSTGTYGAVHSGFWRVWIELGILGLALWASLLFVVFMFGARSPSRILLILQLPVWLAFMYSLGRYEAAAVWVLIGLAMVGGVRAYRRTLNENIPGSRLSSSAPVDGALSQSTMLEDVPSLPKDLDWFAGTKAQEGDGNVGGHDGVWLPFAGNRHS